MKIHKIILGLAACAATANAATTYSGAVGANTDTWNDAANWSAGVPTGTTDVEIGAGESATADGDTATGGPVTTPSYTGSLTLLNSSTVKIVGSNDMQALGTGTITLNAGSSLFLRGVGAQDLSARTFALTGNGATIRVGESTASSGTVIFGSITGSYDLITGGNNNSRARLTSSTTLTSITTIGFFGFGSGNFVLEAYAASSLGTGAVTIADQDSLLVNIAGAFASTSVLNLDGVASNKVGGKLVLNANNTVSSLFIDGVQQAAGDYDNTSGFISGSGILTVVPEPSAALLGGLGCLLLFRRRR